MAQFITDPQMRCVPHSALTYSSRQAPSDFCLLVTLKDQLGQAQVFEVD
jgi:hypothetical protein